MSTDVDEYALLAAEDRRPPIDATNQDLPHVTALALEALTLGNTPPVLLSFGGLPVRVERDERGTPLLRPVTEDRLRHHLARWARWYRPKPSRSGTGEVHALPPMHVVRDLLAHPDLPLPGLIRIIEAPAFDAFGTLRDQPGYCGTNGCGLFYAPAEGFAVPPVAAQPTRGDIVAARQLLEVELLGDFPFISAAEFAHALGLLLLPFARDLIEGPTPLHLVEKPAPGTGATLLVDAVLWPALGRSVPVMTEGRDEDEWRKRLTAKLAASPTVILIDNLRRRLDSAALSGAITAGVWEDRILSMSATVRAPVRCAWVATGNNPGLTNEITRRTIRIRLDAQVARPWLREDFRHPDLRAWMTQERPALVHAALTLIQGWLCEGRPASVRTMGHFESWARVIGGILAHAGITGFLDNLEDFYEESDDETAAWSAFVQAWADRHGEISVGVADLFELLNERVTLDLGDKGPASQRIRLGKQLGGMRDRVFEGYRIISAGEVRRAQQWRLRAVNAVSVVNVSQASTAPQDDEALY